MKGGECQPLLTKRERGIGNGGELPSTELLIRQLLSVKSSESQVVLVKREREMMIQQSFPAGYHAPIL